MNVCPTSGTPLALRPLVLGDDHNAVLLCLPRHACMPPIDHPQSSSCPSSLIHAGCLQSRAPSRCPSRRTLTARMTHSSRALRAPPPPALPCWRRAGQVGRCTSRRASCSGWQRRFSTAQAVVGSTGGCYRQYDQYCCGGAAARPGS